MEENKTQLINEILNIVNQGTSPKKITRIFELWKSKSNNEFLKPIFNLFADAFLSIHAYTTLMLDNCWSQAGTILRTAIEQVSMLFVLSNYHSTVSDFLRVNGLKVEYFQIEKKESKAKFLKDNNLPLSKHELTRFFDYGWITSVSETWSRDDVIKLAHLEEMIDDIKDILNPFAHGKLTVFDFSGEDGSWSVMRRYGMRANMLCFKLYDFWCCSFKKWSNDTKVDEVTSDLFIPFKERYLRLLQG